MGFAAIGSGTGGLAGLLGLAVLGMGWGAALGLWFGGALAGLAAAALLGLLQDGAAESRAPAPNRRTERVAEPHAA